MVNRWTGGLVGVLLGSAVLIAQAPAPAPKQTPTPTPPPSPQQTPVFRTSITVVPLTVTVLDQKGNPITDLKQSDFTVYENRRQREIVNFFPQAFLPGPAGDGPAEGIGPQTHRTFVFVLNDDLFQNVFTALDRIVAFIRDRLEPRDAVALMAFHRTTPITTDHALIARVLERYKTQHDRLVNDLWESSVVTTPALFGTRKPDDPRVVAAQTKVMAQIDALFDGLSPMRNTADLFIGRGRSLPVADNPNLPALVSRSNGFKLFAGIELLRHVDGEKHLVFMSSAGLASGYDEEPMRRVAAQASDAHVIVDMIGNGDFSWGSREVAELTGGFYSTLEYADNAMTRIDRKSRFSYLLGYVPLNPDLDGGFREVDVKVNRAGTVVRFGHGYYARPEPEPIGAAEMTELIVKSRVEVALKYTSNAHDIPLTVTALLLPRMGLQAEVRLDVSIDASKLGLASKEGVRTGQLELQIYCGDAKEVIVGDFSEKLDLEANEETYAKWKQAGLHRVVRVPVNATPKFVKVVVYDYGSDRVGSFVLAIREPRPTPAATPSSSHPARAGGCETRPGRRRHCS